MQGLGGLLGARDDRRDEVRDALVHRELDPLGVDQDHPHLVGRGAHQDRHDQRVDARRLAGAGRAGDQDVRHLGEVGADESALDVLAQPDEHRVVVARGRERMTSPRATFSRSVLGISMPMADLPGIGDRIRTSARQPRRRCSWTAGDPLDLDGRAELDLVARDGRPRVKPVTWASISNWSRTWVRDATTASLAAVRALSSSPAPSRSGAGR